MDKDQKVAGITSDMIEGFYLEYFNNFLTAEVYAEYNYLSVWVTKLLLAEGRKILLEKGPK